MTAKEANAFGKIVYARAGGPAFEAALGLNGKWRSEAFPIPMGDLDDVSASVPTGPQYGFYGPAQVHAAAEAFDCQAVVYDLDLPDLPDGIVF
jgi:hypothetical protein